MACLGYIGKLGMEGVFQKKNVYGVHGILKTTGSIDIFGGDALVDIPGPSKCHRENAGTLEMVPLIINPIYTLYSGYLLGISPFKGLLGGLNS